MPPPSLRGIIERFVEQLAAEVEAARSSEPLVRFLKSAAMFRDYSVANCCLILQQRPDATRVCGYRTWQQLHRQVQRGAKAIWILAPISHRKRDSDERSDEPEIVTTFRSVPVFDIADTTGEPLPEVPILCGASCDEDLSLALTLFADEQGVTVRTEPLPGTAMGVSRGGVIVLDECLDGADRFAVMCHEIAHELLDHRHQRDQLDKKTREVEAETVAFTVCQHFNVSCTAPAYLALHRADAKDIAARLENIVGVTQSVIRGIESNLTQFQPAANQ